MLDKAIGKNIFYRCRIWEVRSLLLHETTTLITSVLILAGHNCRLKLFVWFAVSFVYFPRISWFFPLSLQVVAGMVGMYILVVLTIVKKPSHPALFSMYFLYLCQDYILLWLFSIASLKYDVYICSQNCTEGAHIVCMTFSNGVCMAAKRFPEL